MSKLIDADALLKELESSELQPTKDTDGFIDGWCEGFNTVVDMIRNQPTSYDVEKVVAELEEAKGSSPKTEEDWNYCGAIDEAIDIVKNGGVE